MALIAAALLALASAPDTPDHLLPTAAPRSPAVDDFLPASGRSPATEMVPIPNLPGDDERLGPPGDGGPELPLVPGGFAAPGAWLAVWRGDAWVCWDTAAFQCWQRLDLAGQIDLSTLRVEFVDPSSLVLGDRSDATWLIARGDPVPRLVAWTATPRQTARGLACSPAGPLPVASGNGLAFIERPCPETRTRQDTCVHPGHALRLRRPQPLRLRLVVELQARRDWQRRSDLTATTGLQLLALLVVGLDPAAWLLQRREYADLQAQARPSLRALPRPRSRGPRLVDERLALRAALCGGAR